MGHSETGERLPVSRYALFFLPATIALAVDLVTKSWVFHNYYDPLGAQPSWWIEGVLGIQTSLNPGALFGLGAGYSWLFAIFSVLAIVGILVWLFCFQGFSDRWLTFALGLITGGILGNLYDRCGLGFMEGVPAESWDNVRDWIHFRLEGVSMFDPWPNFNIADSALVCGAILLFFHALFLQPQPAEETDSNTPQDSDEEAIRHV